MAINVFEFPVKNDLVLGYRIEAVCDGCVFWNGAGVRRQTGLSEWIPWVRRRLEKLPFKSRMRSLITATRTRLVNDIERGKMFAAPGAPDKLPSIKNMEKSVLIVKLLFENFAGDHLTQGDIAESIRNLGCSEWEIPRVATKKQWETTLRKVRGLIRDVLRMGYGFPVLSGADIDEDTEEDLAGYWFAHDSQEAADFDRRFRIKQASSAIAQLTTSSVMHRILTGKDDHSFDVSLSDLRRVVKREQQTPQVESL